MGDIDTLYLQGLALLNSSDPNSAAKLVALCEEVIAGSEWASVNISQSTDLSNVVSKLPKDERPEKMNKRQREDQEEKVPAKITKGMIMSPLFSNSLSSGKARLNMLKKDVKKVKK